MSERLKPRYRWDRRKHQWRLKFYGSDLRAYGLVLLPQRGPEHE